MAGFLVSKLELVTCRICGTAFATEKQLEFINQQFKGGLAIGSTSKDICPECARTTWSMQVYGKRL